MKNRKTKTRSVLLVGVATMAVGALAIGPANAQEGILYKLRAGNTNYCHLKFPAIREDTLSWDRPVLKDPSIGDIIDFYGPCDYDPTGKEAVRAQQLDWERTMFRGESD